MSLPTVSPGQTEMPATSPTPALSTAPANGPAGPSNSLPFSPSARGLPPRRKSSKRLVWIVAGAGVLALVIVILALTVFGFGKEPFSGPTILVKKEKLLLTIVERG